MSDGNIWKTRSKEPLTPLLCCGATSSSFGLKIMPPSPRQHQHGVRKDSLVSSPNFSSGICTTHTNQCALANLLFPHRPPCKFARAPPSRDGCWGCFRGHIGPPARPTKATPAAVAGPLFIRDLSFEFQYIFCFVHESAFDSFTFCISPNFYVSPRCFLAFKMGVKIVRHFTIVLFLSSRFIFRHFTIVCFDRAVYLSALHDSLF